MKVHADIDINDQSTTDVDGNWVIVIDDKQLTELVLLTTLLAQIGEHPKNWWDGTHQRLDETPMQALLDGRVVDVLRVLDQTTSTAYT